MFEKLDLRGLLCPEPVIATKKVLDRKEVEQIEAFVDDEICVANLERLARSFKASCSAHQLDGYFSVSISKKALNKEESESILATGSNRIVPDNKKTGTVLFIARDQLGDGDPEFSKTLANVFLQTLFESGQKPRAILLANSGVKLLSEHSSSKIVLEDFRKSGCEVLACGLCVDYYGLKEDIPKEQITNMFAICEYLSAAEKLLQF